MAFERRTRYPGLFSEYLLTVDVQQFYLPMQWSVPEISDENAGTDNPTVVVYPHFASSGMHSDYVDWYRIPEFKDSLAKVG